MKRTIVILALVTAFVLASTAVAQATWRGFTPIRTQAEVDAGAVQGFITWAEARTEMTRNGIAEDHILQSTVHGGYVTTTTKCVTCHSAHRAPAIWNPATPADPNGANATNPFPAGSNTNQFFLTAGADGCEACHVTAGPGASNLLVEWGPNGGGPHAAPNRGCVFCHNTGIHGLGSSEFHVMNVFMLGNTRRGTQGGPSVNPGVGNPVTANNRDGMIGNWMNLVRNANGTWEQRPGTLNPFQRGTILQSPGGANAAATWWYDGTTGVTEIGRVPIGLNVQQYSAARSLATAVTCGEAGCHVTGMFFNLNWGTGVNRADRVNANAGYVPADPANPTQPPGSPTAPAGLTTLGQSPVTGHVMPSMSQRGGAGNATGPTAACGPCHAGHVTGFPTASRVAGTFDLTRRAYGCDQCHDMVGVATNSTAWPHGNRNIAVYEWLSNGTQLDQSRTLNPVTGEVVVGQPNLAASGNLWMYAGNIARAAGQETGDTTLPSSQPQGPNSINDRFADQSWFVMTGVTSGRYGMAQDVTGAAMPGVPATGGNHDTAVNNPNGFPSGLIDGACLKCHVPLDSTSFANTPIPSIGADALRHAWTASPAGGSPENPSWGGATPTGSNRLFLYR